jgi:DMSO/TMAO reductase YedYZ heme-binding membrane subunit
MAGGNRWGNGWVLVAWFSLAALLILVPFQFREGLGEPGLRAGIRLSGRISTLLFMSAFLARPLFLSVSCPVTRWLLENRRYLGVSFASSHTMHLFLILGLAITSASFIHSLKGGTIIGGGLGYIILYAMTATSSDRAVRWLGARRWKILHTLGLYYLWSIFAVTYLGRLKESPRYWPWVILVWGGMVFRFGMLLRNRKISGQSAAVG